MVSCSAGISFITFFFGHFNYILNLFVNLARAKQEIGGKNIDKVVSVKSGSKNIRGIKLGRKLTRKSHIEGISGVRKQARIFTRKSLLDR